MTNDKKRIELKRNTEFAKARVLRDFSKLKQSLIERKKFLEEKHGKAGTVAAYITIPLGVSLGTVIGLGSLVLKKFKKA